MNTEPLKILFLIAHNSQGGDWTIVKTLAGTMHQEATEVWLNGSYWENGSTPPDGPIHLNKGFRGLLSSKKAGSKLPPDLDIIHAHSPVAILISLILRFSRTSKAKIAFTFHWPTKDTFLRKQVKKFLFRQCNAIHCYSKGIFDMLRQEYGVPSKKIKFIYLGVDAKKFTEMNPSAKEQKRANFSWDSGHFVLGYLGRFDREKNVDWLIRFMEEESDHYPDVRLLLYGGGALEKQLRAQSDRLVQAGKVQYGGYTREPESVYGIMDLHLLPSSFEAFALTVVEAGLCGVPTLRTNVEGAIDQIEDGEDGFLSDINGGYPAFADRLKEVLNNHRSELPLIGRRSADKLSRLCDLEKFGINMLQFYESIR